MPDRQAVLLIGDFSGERVSLTSTCAQFGWGVRAVSSFEEIHQLPVRNVAAVLLDLPPHRGHGMLAQVRQRFPDARLVACVTISQQHDWNDLVEAGAYYMLQRPFCETEVRQGLGFLRAALNSADENEPRKKRVASRAVAVAAVEETLA